MLNYTSRPPRRADARARARPRRARRARAPAQGVFHIGTPLTLAETASMFGETIVFGAAARARPPTPDSRLALLAESHRGPIATVFRQVAMNRFEDRVHTERRDEGELSVDALRRALDRHADRAARRLGRGHRGLPRRGGPTCPHFIDTPGYVYAYAYGQLLALVGLRPLRGGGRGVRRPPTSSCCAPAARVARGAGRDRRRRPRRPGLLGRAASTSSSASSSAPSETADAVSD